MVGDAGKRRVGFLEQQAYNGEDGEMAKWRIAWTQVVGDAGALHYVDEVAPPYAAMAISLWGCACWCNARVEAVWRVGCEKVLQDAINRTPGGET